MNARAAAFFEKAFEALLLAMAFLVPVALFLNTFDTGSIKDATLQAGGALALALALARAMEAGRFELPRGRGPFSALVLAWLGWAALSWAPAAAGAQAFDVSRAMIAAALGLAVFCGPASYSFGARLADALLASAAAAAFAALAQKTGSALVGEPDTLGCFLALAFPLALTRALAPERSPMGLALCLAAGAASAAGVLAAGSPAGLLAFAVGALCLMGRLLATAADGRGRTAGLFSGLAAALVWWAAFFYGGEVLDGRILRWSVPEPVFGLGSALAATLAAGVAWTALRDLLRRARARQRREALLLTGLLSGWSALLRGGALSGSLLKPAVLFILWALGGAMAGLALEKGASQVSVLPIALPSAGRRAFYVPLALAAGLMVYLQGRQFSADRQYNLAVFELGRSPEKAVAYLGRVWRWSPHALSARLLTASELKRGGDLRGALGAYEDAAALAPERGAISLEMGKVYAAFGEWEPAFASLKRASALAPLDADVHRALLEVAVKLRRKEDALAAAKGLLRSAPHDPANWYTLAERYAELKRYKEARLITRKAARVEAVARSRGLAPSY